MTDFRLEELLEIKNGRDYKHLSDGNIPVYGSGGLMTYVNQSLYKGESILLPRKGTLSNIQYVNQEFWTVDTVYYSIIDTEKTVPYFLFYYLRLLKLEHLNSGTGVPSMTFGAYYDIPIKLPTIKKQQKIAKVLSDLDAKIELNNKINAELEGMAKLLYDYWFVQFDFPMTAEQAEALGKPELEGKPYKTSGGKMVYNPALKREIPEGWEVKELREFANTSSGGTPLKSKTEYYEEGTIPWINSGEVNTPFIVSAKKFITQKGLDKSSAKLFPKGTILIAMYGATAGKVSFMDIEACTNQAICAVMLQYDFYKEFVKLALEDLYQYLVSLSSGSARDNLSQDKIKDLKFAIPPHDLLKEYHENVNSSMLKILLNMKQNQKLSELRDWLLPMLMNGQVTVRE